MNKDIVHSVRIFTRRMAFAPVCKKKKKKKCGSMAVRKKGWAEFFFLGRGVKLKDAIP